MLSELPLEIAAPLALAILLAAVVLKVAVNRREARQGRVFDWRTGLTLDARTQPVAARLASSPPLWLRVGLPLVIVGLALAGVALRSCEQAPHPTGEQSSTR